MNTVTRLKVPADLPEPGSDEMVQTSSRLCRWRLTMFGGYRVVGSNLIARSTMLGGTRYDRVWVLAPPGESRAGCSLGGIDPTSNKVHYTFIGEHRRIGDRAMSAPQ